jgi:hypothetical protein
LGLVRDGIDLPRADSARLVARSWRALAHAETQMSQTLKQLVKLGRTHPPNDTDEELFEEDRISLLEEQAARLAASAQDRVTHIRHRSRQGV